jgi:hypothetical protein
MANTVKVTCPIRQQTRRYNEMLFDLSSEDGKNCPICGRPVGIGAEKCNCRTVTSLKIPTRPKRTYCPLRDD